MKNISFILAFLFILGQAVSGYSATYYVDDANGDDSNDGSFSFPWKTIGQANSTLNAGDTVYIREGIYDETIEPFNSGAPGEKIIYTNHQDEEVIIRGEPGNLAAISIGWKFHGNWDGKSYIVIDGLTVHPSVPSDETEYARAIFIYGPDSHHNEVRNCRIDGQAFGEDISTRGILLGISKADDNIVEDNYIQGNGRCFYGISIGRLAQFNIIRNNRVIGTWHNCVVIGPSQGIVQGNLIDNNVLCGSVISDGIQFEHDGSLEFDDGSNRGVVIRNNIIFNNAENGIDLKGAADIVIEGNVIYGNMGNNDGGTGGDGDNRGGGLGGIMHGSGAGSRDVIIRNNIIYDCFGGILPENGYKIYNNVLWYNNRDYTGPNSNYYYSRKPVFTGITAWNGLTKVSIKNNIIGGHNSADISVRRNPESLDIDNNLYFNDEGGILVDFRGTNDWEPPLSFNEWQNHLAVITGVTGADFNSGEAEPLFINAPPDIVGSHEQFDFHVQIGSPCIDGGTFLTKVRSTGNGTIIPLEDARYFTDGLGITAGDEIQLEGQTDTASILSVDYDNNIITVDRGMFWNQGQGISLVYHGSSPDIGVYEDFTPANNTPVVSGVTAPLNPVEVNTNINASASFVDPDVTDTHTALWDWGDSSTSPGDVTEADGSGSVSGSHTYTLAGVYTVKLTVTDDDGGLGESTFRYVVVYDTSAGFVTGGGWINSPQGAYIPDTSLTGKANFGFVSKYKKGVDIPTGETEFNFKMADLNFHSLSYEWLVVAGHKAQYKGTGKINGEENYRFMLTAIDEELTPSTDVDLFRIKIWDKDDDTVVYDNQMDAEDDAELDASTTAIGGGNIKIHKDGSPHAPPIPNPNQVPPTNLMLHDIPSKTELLRNYPNPFNPETWIPFNLAEASDVIIRIFNMRGNLVRQFNVGPVPAGYHLSKDKAVHWDGRNEKGEKIASGVYYYTLQAGKFIATRKMVIVK